MPNYSGIWTEQAVMQAVGAGNWPGVPGAPTIGTATAGVGSASVAFTAPTNTGQSTITSYTATSSPGGFTGTGASSPVTVSGLTAGTSYTFTVTATNATGTGPASAASNSITALSPSYIEDVYSTYLYAGVGASYTITNGINLSGNGGLVWIKQRDGGFNYGHILVDSVRGVNKYLSSNTTAAQTTESVPPVSAFDTTGFSLAAPTSTGAANTDAVNYASWTFQEQTKFFDIVTWSGNNTYGRTIPHNLGSVPGCIIVKCTSIGATNWCVYHRGLTTPTDQGLYLNATDAAGDVAFWAYTAPTSTVFSLSASDQVNATGSTYVAYVFAHNAGGFGASGTDNVISCGSYTGTGAVGNTITIGYEPQWLLVKKTSGTGDWFLMDNMRGFSETNTCELFPNSSAAEDTAFFATPTATGFKLQSTSTYINGSGSTYIYIAIRRGPMKTPTVGTSVFSSAISSSTTTTITSGFVTDWAFTLVRAAGGASGFGRNIYTRLQGNFKSLNTAGSDMENSNSSTISLSQNDGIKINGGTVYSQGFVYEQLQRAPGFMDVVCYTGTSAVRTINHNLGVVPELMIVKSRSLGGAGWPVYASTVGNTKALELQGNFASFITSSYWNDTSPTSTVFTIGDDAYVNNSGSTYVASLFATCPGVSKVGSYTGTGAAQTINCGFTGGSRFVFIKRTDSTGDWYLWDSARGIIPSNDPYILTNLENAEVTGTDYVDTTAVGFDITSTAPAAINANGGTYIFLAIA